MPDDGDGRRRQVRFLHQPGPNRVVDVVVDVGDEVGHARDLALERRRPLAGIGADRGAALALGVLGDAVAHFPRQVQPAPVVLEHVDDAQALLVVVEPARHQVAQHALAGVAERRVAQVVPERDRFGQLLVQVQHLGDGPRDLRHLERVRQPRAVVIAGRREEDLRLVLQAAERLAVDDPVAVALKRRADVVFRLGTLASARVGGLGRLRAQGCRARAARVACGSETYALEEAGAVPQRADAKDVRDGLAEIGKRVACPQVDPRSPIARRSASTGTCSRE